jgi:hypothetical protein
MNNFSKKASLFTAGALALIGLSNKNVQAFDNSDKAPLFLEHGSHVLGAPSTDHESHYSHESHASHASHASGY